MLVPTPLAVFNCQRASNIQLPCISGAASTKGLTRATANRVTEFDGIRRFGKTQGHFAGRVAHEE